MLDGNVSRTESATALLAKTAPVALRRHGLWVSLGGWQDPAEFGRNLNRGPSSMISMFAANANGDSISRVKKKTIKSIMPAGLIGPLDVSSSSEMSSLDISITS